MRIAALLVVLAARPAVALKPVSCLGSASAAAPASLDALRACQDAARTAAVAAAAGSGTPLTDAQLDEIDEYQRAEARKFLSRRRGAVAGQAEPPSTPPSADGAAGKPAGSAPKDLPRADPKDAAAVADLRKRLQLAAGDGGNGVTPAMAGDIQATLLQTQGSISPEMKGLLDAVSRDGGMPTPDTMKKVQGAGKAAKDAGLDLGIDPALQKQLLEHDFDEDKPAFESQQAPPGTM
jgi:hypothetical protein